MCSSALVPMLRNVPLDFHSRRFSDIFNTSSTLAQQRHHLWLLLLQVNILHASAHIFPRSHIINAHVRPYFFYHFIGAVGQKRVFAQNHQPSSYHLFPVPIHLHGHQMKKCLLQLLIRVYSWLFLNQSSSSLPLFYANISVKDYKIKMCDYISED